MSILTQHLWSVVVAVSALTLAIGTIYTSYLLLNLLLRYRRFSRRIDRIPGPGYSLLNPYRHLTLFRPTKQDLERGLDVTATYFRAVERLSREQQYKNHFGIVRLWFSLRPIIAIFRAEAAERILTSSLHIEKGWEYKLLRPWLGDGLLTSHGEKWHARRKMITPAFHFNILEAFLPTMLEQANVLVEKIQNQIRKQGEKSFVVASNSNSTNQNPATAAAASVVLDVSEWLTYCALDVICETAMGIKIGSQANPNLDYVHAMHRVGQRIIRRFLCPWLWHDWSYFSLTSEGRADQRDLQTLHQFTMDVIQERKREKVSSEKQKQKQKQKGLQKRKSSYNLTIEGNGNEQNEQNQNSPKRRLAFLDILLEQHLKDPINFTLNDVREEVDTFMFEGHDTTTVSMVWTLFLLGHHPEVQTRVQAEIDDIFDRDQINEKTNPLTTNHLREMKLLEACIKESLRLYPSVPYIARLAAEDIHFTEDLSSNSDSNSNSFIIPKGSTIFLFISLIQQDDKYFPSPEQFVPDRYTEGHPLYRKVSPFALVPFSAGPRNCIGQKFALQEEKVILSAVLRRFRIESLKPVGEMVSSPELVQRNKEPVMVRFVPRRLEDDSERGYRTSRQL